MIKINDIILNEQQIAVLMPEGFDGTRVHLNCGAMTVIPASMEDVLAAYEAAGMFKDSGDPVGIALTDAERQELLEFYKGGFRWVAADKDGRIYAYMKKPERDGAYWYSPSSPAEVELTEDFDAISFEDEPLDLAALFADE